MRADVDDPAILTVERRLLRKRPVRVLVGVGRAGAGPGRVEEAAAPGLVDRAQHPDRVGAGERERMLTGARLVRARGARRGRQRPRREHAVLRGGPRSARDVREVGLGRLEARGDLHLPGEGLAGASRGAATWPTIVSVGVLPGS